MIDCTSPTDVEIGKYYRIKESFGAGEHGVCVGIRSTEFGFLWGEIRTGTGSYWVRWQLLQKEEDGLG